MHANERQKRTLWYVQTTIGGAGAAGLFCEGCQLGLKARTERRN